MRGKATKSHQEILCFSFAFKLGHRSRSGSCLLREAVADFLQGGFVAQRHLIVFIAIDAQPVLRLGAKVIGH